METRLQTKKDEREQLALEMHAWVINSNMARRDHNVSGYIGLTPEGIKLIDRALALDKRIIKK